MAEEGASGVVLDMGSGITKAGFSGDDSPKVIFPTVVGEYQTGKKDSYIGEDIYTKSDNLSLSSPVDRGLISNWDDAEKIWHHAFKQLKVDPADQKTLLVEWVNNKKEIREKTAQIMFEKFRVPGLYLTASNILTLYASGRQNGLVLESGDGVTSIVPIYEGYKIPLAIPQTDVAGRDITQYLSDLLTEGGVTLSDVNDARLMKEKLCFVAQDGPGGTEAPPTRLNKDYTTPDGVTIQLNEEQYKCAEPFFKPALLGLKSPGLAQALLDCINKCDINVRKDLYRNIVVSGGSTTMVGFVDRLKSELTQEFPEHMKDKFRIHAPNDRKHSSWIGGSLLSSFDAFKDKWVTKQEYEEHGPSIIAKKCF